MNPRELNEMLDEKEEGIASCFKAVRGNQDSLLCMEKVNQVFNRRLEHTFLATTQTFKQMLS